jgi:hypothetical protein
MMTMKRMRSAMLILTIIVLDLCLNYISFLLQAVSTVTQLVLDLYYAQLVNYCLL